MLRKFGIIHSSSYKFIVLVFICFYSSDSLNSSLFAFVVNNNGNGGEGGGEEMVQLNRGGGGGGASDNQNFQHQFLAHVRDVGMQVIVGDALEAQAAAAAPPPAGNGGGNGGGNTGRGRMEGGNGGGQTSPSSANSELLYSGLYVYHIPTNTWSLLRSDVASPKPTRPAIRSRVGHSMLLHPALRKLFVFGGQRSKEYLNDFFAYNVDTDEVELISDGQKQKVTNHQSYTPTAGFTQRATIDPELNEIYIFSVSCTIMF